MKNDDTYQKNTAELPNTLPCPPGGKKALPFPFWVDPFWVTGTPHWVRQIQILGVNGGYFVDTGFFGAPVIFGTFFLVLVSPQVFLSEGGTKTVCWLRLGANNGGVS